MLRVKEEGGSRGQTLAFGCEQRGQGKGEGVMSQNTPLVGEGCVGAEGTWHPSQGELDIDSWG